LPPFWMAAPQNPMALPPCRLKGTAKSQEQKRLDKEKPKAGSGESQLPRHNPNFGKDRQGKSGKGRAVMLGYGFTNERLESAHNDAFAH